MRGESLHAGQHFLGVGARVDPGKAMGDDAVRIDDVGDPAGKTSPPGAIRLAQDMVRIVQQREGKASVGGEGFVVFDRVKTGPENLHVALRESVMEVTEPAPFGRSSPRIGFGINPLSVSGGQRSVYTKSLILLHPDINDT